MKTIIILFLGLGLVACKGQTENTKLTKGSLLFAVGDVSISHAGVKQVAKKGDLIQEGDTINTGDKSAAIVEFEGNSGSVEIQQNSEFTISKFNDKDQELIAKTGTIWLNAKKLKKDTNFQVILPTAVAGIRGTKLFSFENKEIGVTGVCHCQGAVDFKDNTSNYSGSHDTDQLVITKNGKTILLLPEDFHKAGIPTDDAHNHSMLEDSPLGKKADPERVKKVIAFIEKKFAEK